MESYEIEFQASVRKDFRKLSPDREVRSPTSSRNETLRVSVACALRLRRSRGSAVILESPVSKHFQYNYISVCFRLIASNISCNVKYR